VHALPLPPGQERGQATAVSYNGRLIAGFSYEGPGPDRALRWVDGELHVVAENALALAISADGARIVGEKGNDGILWDPVLGEVNLREYINSLGGAIPPGSARLYPSAISGDSGTIAGSLDVTGGGGGWHAFVAHIPKYCYANCDGSVVTPMLDARDLLCFANRFAAGDELYANCDRSMVPPVLNVLDFNCFLNKFTLGCP
jgi:hypothetical protein